MLIAFVTFALAQQTLNSSPSKQLSVQALTAILRAQEQASAIEQGTYTGPIILSPDDLVYLGGGVTARPLDLTNTTITPNWKMIGEEARARTKPDLPLPYLLPLQDKKAPLPKAGAWKTILGGPKPNTTRL
jgi:hypothetical protein